MRVSAKLFERRILRICVLCAMAMRLGMAIGAVAGKNETVLARALSGRPTARKDTK